jgi:hypothetical protein
MEREKYLEAIEKLKPWEVDWNLRAGFNYTPEKIQKHRESGRWIYNQEEKWSQPWQELEDLEQALFCYLFQRRVSTWHDHGPADAPEPDFRLLLITTLEDDQKFIDAMTRG